VVKKRKNTAARRRTGVKPVQDTVALRKTREDQQIDEGSPVFGRPTAGVYIDADTSLRNDTVWACVRYLSQTVAQLPARVMRDQGRYSERVMSHPVVNVMTWRSNPELSPFQLKETLTAWAVMRGNGIAEIERDDTGRVLALWPIHPDRVTFKRDLVTDELVYEINNGRAGTVYLTGRDVFHLRGFGNGPIGLSVVEHAAESIGWAQATELFGAAFFGNGLNTSGAIEGAGSLNDDGQKRLSAQIARRHGGPRKSHLPLYLDKSMKWVPTSVKPNEAQFIEAMQHQVETICRWFGVPPQKVGHLLRMTFNNVEQLSIEVVVDSITPWAIRWEEEANFKLFGQNRNSLFMKLEMKGLLRGAFKERQEGLQIQRRNGIINQEDWREIEDYGPSGAEGSEKYIVEGNMTTLERLGEEPEAVPPAPAPAPSSNDNSEDDTPDAPQMARIATRLAQARVMLNAA